MGVRALRRGHGSQILISLLIPFACYLLAEHLECSGILAAVAAGVTMSFAESRGRVMAVTRVRRSTVWDTIQYAANGIIFVLLGEQLPAIVSRAAETVSQPGQHEITWLILYAVAITAGLAALRFTWVWLSLQLTLLRRRDRTTSPSWRIVAAMSCAGVRGAVTLAGVLTLPLTLNDGSPFPARDLAISLAMGVIIVSLLVATFGLPLLLRGLELPPEPSQQAEEDAARIAAAEAAIAEIGRLLSQTADQGKDADLYVAAASQLTDLYHRRIERRSAEGDSAETAQRSDRIEREMRLAALNAERAEIFRKVRRRQLGSKRRAGWCARSTCWKRATPGEGADASQAIVPATASSERRSTISTRCASGRRMRPWLRSLVKERDTVSMVRPR